MGFTDTARKHLVLSDVTTPKKKRVLISYRHESSNHRDRVLELAQQLRRDGIDAWIDRFASPPAKGWSYWMDDELARADRVIVICSKKYLDSARRSGKEREGLGGSWEWHSIRREFYESRGSGNRVTPVFFSAEEEQFVPKEAWDRPRYLIVSLDQPAYKSLVRDLRGDPEIMPVPLNTGLGEANPEVSQVKVLSEGISYGGGKDHPLTVLTCTIIGFSVGSLLGLLFFLPRI